MLRVGLTGGLASGKSFVGHEFLRLGCHLVEADELGHSVLAKGGEVYGPVVAHFGSGILKEDGDIDRARLAAEVFPNPERLAYLNSLVHPAVIAREERLIEDAEADDPAGIAVVEAAILIETGSYRRFAKLIVAVCTEEQQVERALKRGYVIEEVKLRLSRQLPLAEKRKFADYIIDTSSSKEVTLQQVRHVYEELRRLGK